MNTATIFDTTNWQDEEQNGEASRTESAALPKRAKSYISRETERLVQGVLAPQDGRPAPRQVVFCGLDERVSTARLCLEVARALEDNTVCLVEGEFDNRQLADALRLTRRPHTPSTQPLRERCVEAGENLWFAGPDVFYGTSGSLVSPDHLQWLMEELAKHFTYVLVNAPTLAQSSAAVLFGKCTEATVMVLSAATKKQEARKATDTLRAAKVRLLGTVLTGRDLPIPEAIYSRL